MAKPPRKLARDWSVRNLGPPDGRTRALADRLGVEVYDGKRAAYEAGLPQLPWRDRVLGWVIR